MIHIAGTNGKGSTAHSLAAVLQASGYRTGLFTSPHLVDFRERIRVDGRMMESDRVVDFVERYLAMDLGLHPSFFELTTIMALDYFARSGVEVAVIETGLGGRLDTTNIITPCLSVITNISLDHTSLLGDTPGRIAVEKAGIIKPGVTAVIGEAPQPDVRAVFEAKGRQVGAPVIFAEDDRAFDEFEMKGEMTVYHTKRFGVVESSLTGECQLKNMNTVLTALQQLSPLFDRISRHSIAAGLKEVSTLTGLRGRWETISTSPRVVIDTGHNPGGWQYIVNQINSVDAKTRHIVFGMAADKDIDTVLAMLGSVKSHKFYFTAPSSPRALPAAELHKKAIDHGLEGAVFESVAEAYDAARGAATPSDFIFIGGSNFLIADFLCR